MPFIKPQFLLIFWLLIISVSCTPTRSFEKAMASHPPTLSYLVEPPSAIKKVNKSIFISTDQVYNFPSIPVPGVERKKWYWLPLIFYYKLYQEYEYNILTSALKENPNDFLLEGFSREAKRHCKYQIVQNPDIADYHLILKIDSLTAFSNFTEINEQIIIPLFGTASGSSINATYYDYEILEARAHCQLSYYLTNKNNKVIKEASYYSSHSLPGFYNMGVYIYNPSISINASLAEGLSETFKDNFKAIIEDLNQIEASPLEQQKEQLHKLFDD